MAANFHIYDDAEHLAAAAANFILEKIKTCLNTSPRCRIALPGGRTPASCLRLLAQSGLPWERIDWFLGDERCLPIGDEERNDVMIRKSLFSASSNIGDNFRPIKAELGAKLAADDYAKMINDFDVFDIVILGMGEDGHTASLFPDNDALNNNADSVVAVFNAPKPPQERVSLSLKTLTDAKVRIILAAGSDKKLAINKVKAGEQLPINRIGDSDWFVDATAVG